MLLMTGLTFVKELARFQVIESGLWMHLYHFARDHYYNCLSLIFAMALAVIILPQAWHRTRHPRTARPTLLLAALWMVGGLNLFLLTANNGINLLEGRPLHSPHQGIGW
ncbi:MAG: hypothetical protein QOE70_5817 [Chthoniobacter sp.]|jgi:hypothetical protein|nr:hypothetical protein [Chthoniobacter sp.]